MSTSRAPARALEAPALLERLARRARRERQLGIGLAALGVGALAAAIGVAIRADGWAAVAGGTVAAAIVAFVLRRSAHVEPRQVAQHLDRTVPALEESTELVLEPERSLRPLEQLQRRRMLDALGRLPQDPALPRQLAGRLAALGGACLALALGLMTAVEHSRGAAAPRPNGGRTAAMSSAAARITGVELEVRPPAYTRRAARRGTDWDVVAEEGALVTWRVRSSRAVGAAQLITSAGDTIPLRPDGADARTLVGALSARASVLYQVGLDSGALATASDYHRLSVATDGAPTVAVLAPAPRSEIARGQAPVVEVVATVSDDYRVAGSGIVATVTSGSGEAVRFREQVLAFESSVARTPPAGQAHALTLRRRLDLRALGMGPGDELYFHVRATDNRPPRARESRSETYFVSLADTAQPTLAAVSGIALNVAPEYFRSQRQIIIDTEKLIADRPRLRLQEFRDRSNEIGADQHLLRVRYGEIVGDEMAEGDADPQAGHQHDTEENATLLAASVKTTLKAALAEMWQAELKLRTYEPAAALPYENRALELLKQVQQAARSYVQRVGFEPPPLEPDRRRLQGELEGIPTRTVRDSAVREPADAELRSALAVLQRPRLIAEPGAADLAALEDAGRELGRRAVEEPGPLLATLRDVRRLHDSLAARRPCPGCVAAVQRGLWSALRPVEPSPNGGSAPASALGRRYFELLQIEWAP